MRAYAIIETDMTRDAVRLRAVRRAVFIDEQGVPEAMEWDEYDAVSLHWLAVAADGTPIACARLLPDGHLGRMAVLPAWRGQGVGRALLDRVLAAAVARGHRFARLSAQIQAAGFYRRAGFVEEGREYLEANIPHVAMLKNLA
jgi:predicted GNAT family N-acyltransferase